jgi:hypothetical protein
MIDFFLCVWGGADCGNFGNLTASTTEVTLLLHGDGIATTATVSRCDVAAPRDHKESAAAALGALDKPHLAATHQPTRPAERAASRTSRMRCLLSDTGKFGREFTLRHTILCGFVWAQ